jgi:hypothetical protein
VSVESKNSQFLKNQEYAGKEKRPRWFEPCEANGFRRYFKVAITSNDEATIFIILTKPVMPEYSINNFTDREVSFYQKDTKKEKIERYCKPALYFNMENKGKF